MASFERTNPDQPNTIIHYDDEGVADGFPVLLIAPGGMRSCNEIWQTSVWNPREHLASQYRVIGMDQRNAGRSTAPVNAEDGWPVHTADQLALLDHLEIDRCHVVGMCIGGPYIAALLQAAPERFASAVMLQPVGLSDNRQAFYDMFDAWAEPLAEGRLSDVAPEAWESYRSNMWDGEFLLTASEDEVAAWTTPLLVAMGNDLYHPQPTSRTIVELLPDTTFLEEWKDEASLPATNIAIQEFLSENSPT